VHDATAPSSISSNLIRTMIPTKDGTVWIGTESGLNKVILDEKGLPSGFNPNYFSKDAVNKELEKFGVWHRKHPRKKSTPWHQLD